MPSHGIDAIIGETEGPQRGSDSLRPDRAPHAVGMDELLGEVPDTEDDPADDQQPADEPARSPIGSGGISAPDELALARKPRGIDVNLDLSEAGAVGSVIGAVTNLL